MLDYNQLDNNIKTWIEEIVKEDKYNLQPETLYNNIYNSTGDERQLSQLFEVPIGLIRAIKKESKG